MADPRFYSTVGPFTLSEIASAAGARLARGFDPAAKVHAVAPLSTATAQDLSFLDNRKYLSRFMESRAGACFAPAALADRAPAGMAVLVSKNPYKSYALAAHLFHPVEPPVPGVHERAIVDPAAVLAEDCRIEAGAVIAAGARIGARCRIDPNAVIGAGVEIGADSCIGAAAVLSHCLIGERVLIHRGVGMGQDGFGFVPDPQEHVKVPQVGRVVIEDDVEIGANCAIDRGSSADTVIGRGSRLDNLVQIAHNVRIGRGCLIAGQVGIAGSTTLGDFVMIGGQAGVSDHLSVGSGVRLAAQTGAIQDIEPGAICGGTPAVPIRLWHRQSMALARLATGKTRVKER